MNNTHNSQPVRMLVIGSQRHFSQAKDWNITATPQNMRDPRNHFIGLRPVGWVKPDADNDKRFKQ